MTSTNKSISNLDNVIPDISIKEITKIIAAASAKASGVAALPIPIIDIAGVSFIQVRMVDELAQKYGIVEGDKSRLIISSLASNLFGMLVTTATEKLAAKSKVDKFLGETLIKATIAGLITTLMGEVYANHFKKGGTLNNVSFNDTVDYFVSQLNSDRVNFDRVTEMAMTAINDKISI